MAAILDPVCGLWVTIGRLCVQFHIFPTLCVHKHATEIFSNDAANTTSFAQLHEALQYGDQKKMGSKPAGGVEALPPCAQSLIGGVRGVRGELPIGL